MSDIESRMFLLYAYAMSIRILKQKLVQLINYYQKKDYLKSFTLKPKLFESIIFQNVTDPINTI